MTSSYSDITNAIVEIFGYNPVYPKTITIQQTDKTYPVKQYLWDNWFPFAYFAFKELTEIERKGIKSFASIGTSNGADAIGALFSFPNLETIILTDIDKDVVPVAEKNVRKYSNSKEVIALCGSLSEPLCQRSLRADVIYENLPNIPNGSGITDGYKRASCYDRTLIRDKTRADGFIKSYLLESHYTLLLDAKNALNSEGSVICSVGGRVPNYLLQEMVQYAGYGFSELLVGFKRQTEPWEVLPGYAEAEINGIEFDFYFYDKAVKNLLNHGLREPFIELTGNELKNLLEPFRVNAKQALGIYNQERQSEYDNNVNIGHTVHMIRARKTITLKNQ